MMSKIKMMSKKKLMIRIMLLLIGVIMIATAVFVYQLKTNIDEMIIPKTNPKIDTSPLSYQSEDLEKDNSNFYVLVIGLDYREDHDALLTDTLMLLQIIPEESNVKLLSIPRDLLVENSRGNIVKINSLFSEGYYQFKKKAADDPSILTGETVRLGSRELDKAVLSGSMATTRQKIEELLAIEIDHMVLVNFDTLTSLVDEVGGIEIDVKRSMKYRATNLYLEPGLQVLNGEDALGYARFRKDDRGSRYYASDFERGKHQQEVVKALAKEILSWKNVTKTLKLLNIVSTNVKTDLEYKDMYSMITKYYDRFNGNSFLSIPFPEYYSQDGDVIIPKEALDTLRDELLAVK